MVTGITADSMRPGVLAFGLLADELHSLGELGDRRKPGGGKIRRANQANAGDRATSAVSRIQKKNSSTSVSSFTEGEVMAVPSANSVWTARSLAMV